MNSKHNSTKANESRTVSDGEVCVETEDSRRVAEDIKQQHAGNALWRKSISKTRNRHPHGKLP